MRYLVVIFVLFLGVATTQASPVLVPVENNNPWGFGVGFGTESNYDSVTLLEVRTPTLFSFLRGTNQIALALTYETKEISGVDKDITPIHLLIELTSLPYKDFVRTYVRVGGGSVLIDDNTIYPASNFFNLQFQVGADFITGFSPTGVGSSFFVQAMVNSPAIRNPPLGYAEIYDGTTLLLGMRVYF